MKTTRCSGYVTLISPALAWVFIVCASAHAETIAYDTGDLGTSYSAAWGYYYANRFTNDSVTSVSVDAVLIYRTSAGGAADVYLWADASGSPGTLIGGPVFEWLDNTWQSIDVSSLGLTIPAGGSIFAGFEPRSTAEVPYDTASPGVGRSWWDQWGDGGWVQGGPAGESGNLMVRLEVVSDANTLTLLAPNGGEELLTGSVYEITWETEGTVESVFVEYSTNNGTDWTAIDTVSNVGLYEWNVPEENSGACLIRISDASDPGINDISDDVFTISTWIGGRVTVQITNNSYDDRYPQISGSNVVWQGYDGNDWEIFLYDGADTHQLTNNTEDDRLPVISGCNVAWVRGSGYDTDEIFFYDGSTTIQLTNNSYREYAPQISGSNVTWEGRGGTQGGGLAEIYLYDGVSVSQITDNNYEDEQPQISGSNITWLGYNGVGGTSEVYLYDGFSTHRITNDAVGHTEYDPRVSGSRVVWDANIGVGPKQEVYLYDGVTTITLTAGSGNDKDPMISGSNVVWRGWNGTAWEVYLYDGTSTQAITSNSYTEWDLQIDGANVVWYGAAGAGGTAEIFLYDGTSIAQLTQDSYDDYNPRVSGDNVVWYKNDGTDREIFLSVPGPPPTPADPTASANICGDKMLTRSGSPPAGVTWYWQGTSCGTSTDLGSDATHIATASGTYYIRARDNTTELWSPSCGSVTVTVNPNPEPTIIATPGEEVCEGATVTLDAGAGYSSYLWSPGGETTQTIQVTTSGTYSVTVTDANGCEGMDDIAITVNANPAPVIIATPAEEVCEGTMVNLDAGAGYSSYLWSPGEETTQTIDVTTSGSYSVTVTDADGCEGTDDVTVTVHQSVRADFDADCDVDQNDVDIFEACATGPAIPYDPENLPLGCSLTPDGQGIIAADFDEDHDIDQEDFGVFQRCISGEDVWADPGCAD